jgi:plastocyanin domain-containing protein
MTNDEIIVTLVGIALIAFVLWFFLGGSKDTASHDHMHH